VSLKVSLNSLDLVYKAVKYSVLGMEARTTQILRLSKKNFPQKVIAARLRISTRTVKRHFQKIHRKDPKVLRFTRKLERLARMAPNEQTKKEINKTIFRLRKPANKAKYKQFYPLILLCLYNGALELQDFVIDTDLSSNLLRNMLKEMECGGLINSKRHSQNSPLLYSKN